MTRRLSLTLFLDYRQDRERQLWSQAQDTLP